MPNFVADGKSLPHWQASTVDRYHGPLFESDDRRFAAMHWSISDGSAEVPSNRFEINVLGRRDTEGNQDAFGRGDCGHSFSASRSSRSASSRSSSSPSSSTAVRSFPFRAARSIGIFALDERTCLRIEKRGPDGLNKVPDCCVFHALNSALARRSCSCPQASIAFCMVAWTSAAAWSGSSPLAARNSRSSCGGASKIL